MWVSCHDLSGTDFEVNIGHVRGGASLQFKLLARAGYHTLGAPVFEEIARSSILNWPIWPTMNPSGPLAAESWDLPTPTLLPVPEEFESTGRWRGRALLLSWPKGVQVCEDPPLELQACSWDMAGHMETCDVNGWKPVSWALLQVHGLPCIAASQLPFTRCRLRWYSCDRCVPGPCSEPCLTFIDTPAEVASTVLCTITAVKARCSFELQASNTTSTASNSTALISSILFFQWRFGAVKPGNDGSSTPAEWRALDPQSLAACSSANSKSAKSTKSIEEQRRSTKSTEYYECLIGEEEGLDFGSSYVFSVRVSDGRRSSAWSEWTAPMLSLS